MERRIVKNDVEKEAKKEALWWQTCKEDSSKSVIADNLHHSITFEVRLQFVSGQIEFAIEWNLARIN